MSASVRWPAAGLFCLVAGFSAPGSEAATTVRVRVDTHAEASDDPQARPDESLVLTVTLSDRRFSVASSTGTSVYDFVTRRRIVIDAASGTRVDYSLFDLPAFRLYELANRNALSRALATTKVATAMPTPVENEHDLGIANAPAGTLRVTHEGDDDVFSSESTVLARYRRGQDTMPAEDFTTFVKYLRHTDWMHPQVLAAIAATNHVPARVVWTTSRPRVTRTATFLDVAPSTAAPIEVGAFPLRPASADEDPIDIVLDRAAAFTNDERAAARQQSVDDATRAFADGRVLEALLSTIERNQLTGEGIAFSADERAALHAEPAALRLLTAMGATGKDAVKAAIRTLDDLRPLAPSKGYLIDLSIANHLAVLGNHDRARRMIVEVLQGHPHIGSAYKDLGSLLVAQWDVPRGWRSYDLARRFAPTFPSVAAIDQVERSLLTAHPEFF